MSERQETAQEAPDFDRTPPDRSGEIEQVSPLIRRLVAPNPGPFTFTGTCVYIVGRGDVAVIDPGPAIPHHVEHLVAALGAERIRFIMTTHTHRDHSPAAGPLRAATGAPIVGCAPISGARAQALGRSQDLDYRPDRVLQDGGRVALPGATLTAVATPGHASNHLAFAFEEERALFSGDHVMAWSTTVVSPPDGNMSDYMRSLERLRARSEQIYWPGHGGPVRDPGRFVRALAAHRRHRELLILAGLRAGDRTVAALVARLYSGLDPKLRGGAARSVFAHLEDMAARGLVASSGPMAIDADFSPVGGESQESPR